MASFSTDTKQSMDVQKMDEFRQDIEKEFLSGFNGVPIRVDTALQGNEYYCAVSEEVFDKLKKMV